MEHDLSLLIGAGLLCLKIKLRLVHRLNDICLSVLHNGVLGSLWGIGLNMLFLRMVRNMREVLYRSSLCVFATGGSYATVLNGNVGRRLTLRVL